MNYTRGSLEERFWSKVEKSDGCWNWLGWKDADGYGHLWLRKEGRKNVYILAPRLSWTFAFGVVPKGLCVCHTCDNPACVKPAHLFLGTNQVNQADKVAKGRQLKGERQWAAKLTERDVCNIRSRYRRGVNPAHPGGPNTYDLAKEFGVSQVLISRIVRRKAWKEVA